MPKFIIIINLYFHCTHLVDLKARTINNFLLKHLDCLLNELSVV
jgi:hypothetical protein